jgi:hypothetical protein
MATRPQTAGEAFLFPWVRVLLPLVRIMTRRFTGPKLQKPLIFGIVRPKTNFEQALWGGAAGW